MKKSLSTALIFALLFIATISFASASVDCSGNTNIDLGTYKVGESPSSSISCTNNGNSTIHIDKILGEFFSIDTSTINPGDTEDVKVTSWTNISSDTYDGAIEVDDKTVTVEANVEPKNECRLNPSVGSFYQQQAVQGLQYDMRPITFSPQNCPNSGISLSGSDVVLNGGTQTQQGRKPVHLNQISNNSITLGVNTKGLPTQTYNDISLEVSHFGVTSKVDLPFVVTSSASPSGNFSVNDLASSCSLDSSTLGVDSEHTLTCNIENPDVTVRPEADSSYIIGKNVESGSGSYKWIFEPQQSGTANITANFEYLGAPVGQPFNKQVKITPSGENVGQGVNLGIRFYQNNEGVSVEDLESGNTTVQVVDNQSGNLRTDSSTILINGQENDDNVVNLEYGEDYELIASSAGYNDRELNFNVTKSGIGINIEPEKDKYLFGEEINITTEPKDNVSVLVQGRVIGNPQKYEIDASGNVTIEAVSEGFEAGTKNITVDEKVEYTTASPQPQEWGDNEEIMLELSENSSWRVYYQPLNDDGSYGEQQEISSGDGKRVDFETSGEGVYTVEGKKSQVVRKEIKKQGLSDFFEDNTIWVILGAIVAVGFIWYFFFRDEDNPASNVQFTGPPQSQGGQ